MMTDEQKKEVVLIAAVGCDRETAARYVGCSLEQLNTAALADPDFAARVRRAEAGCELAHMRSIQQAAKDPKNWRASVWWLERRMPERYAKREAGTVSRRELTRFLKAVAAGLVGALERDEDRERVRQTLKELTGSLNDPLAIEQAAVDSNDAVEQAELEERP